MQNRLSILFGAILICFGFLAADVSCAQDLHQDLVKFVETPAVSGYEQTLVKEIRARLAKWKPQTDSLGNVIVNIGAGSPHRVIATLMDEPGYVVSGITADGFLRVQRLPQGAPNPVFDTLYSTQPIIIQTRSGKIVPGVVAGLSTHLQPARLNAPQPGNLDDVYVDIGATSGAEVRASGVDVLDPLAIDRHLYDMGFGRMTSPAIGDRSGCAALVEMLRNLDAGQVKGTLTIAFLGQEWLGARGMRRILAQNNSLQPIDEMIYVAPLLSRRVAAGRGANAGAAATLISPKMPEGSGVLIGDEQLEGKSSELAKELSDLAKQNNIKFSDDFTNALAPATGANSLVLPKKFAHIGIATRWLATPSEMIDGEDLVALTRLLEVYVVGRADTQAASTMTSATMARPAMPKRPTAAPTPSEAVAKLVEAYGVSEHEKDVHDTVLALLPSWAKTTTDDAGNIWLHWGSESRSAKSIVFVAHMDEIGYNIRKIDDDGKLEVISRGGGITYFFGGHDVLVHTPEGDRPGILELPANWDQPSFEWPRAGGAAADGEGPAPWRVDIGARTAAEAEQLGVTTKDWITVPKKYRKLVGTRANGRSFDDRVGCAALVEATWALGPQLAGRDVTFIWSTGEEIGLVGAGAAAKKLAAEGHAPQFVFAIDTFVSADSPIESKRFADAIVGHGFVVRAVDNSNVTPREFSDRVVQIAKSNQIPAQYGVTGGGNDGSMFVPFGSTDVGLGWPLRYSHSPGEVIDTRDLDALAHIVAAISKSW
jgi:putative aminopeptidase